jgi:2-(3-amino-3-carboxypropyl)histidine synthase
MQDFDLELDRIVKHINSKNVMRVCVQLPDGLKRKAKDIVDYLTEKTNSEIFIWAGSCYGACDMPVHIDRFKFDLLVQWGHSEWEY